MAGWSPQCCLCQCDQETRPALPCTSEALFLLSGHGGFQIDPYSPWAPQTPWEMLALPLLLKGTDLSSLPTRSLSGKPSWDSRLVIIFSKAYYFFFLKDLLSKTFYAWNVSPTWRIWHSPVPLVHGPKPSAGLYSTFVWTRKGITFRRVSSTELSLGWTQTQGCTA